MTVVMQHALIVYIQMVANGVVHKIQSYSSKRAFIAAQSPMAETRNDIWELIWQFRTSTIVLLCGLRENSHVRSMVKYIF